MSQRGVKDDDDFKIGAIPFYRLRGEFKLE